MAEISLEGSGLGQIEGLLSLAHHHIQPRLAFGRQVLGPEGDDMHARLQPLFCKHRLQAIGGAQHDISIRYGFARGRGGDDFNAKLGLHL